MNAEIMDTISESFVTVVPLLKKKLFRTFPIDNMPYQLSRSNLEVLFALYESRTSTVSELSNLMHISRPNMTPLVDKLVQHELVDRRTSNEDRRVIQIRITDAGDRLCKEMHERLMNQIKSKLDSLEHDDLIELQKCMVSLKSIALKINA
ncbi:MarR family transcriptional regulator [Cohnella lupini]|uniref:MarR family transcriptional regulator n=1 Tax=Cohnella lupini TaxID=1294267 RepID=A0A3D9I8Q5_9BACL|nr:MarR family transcriptional regulator [Cohnella lupini]RED58070.1 MarR family transcriptional regulator [Cohnella lupini]